jgi:hypothetical protein
MRKNKNAIRDAEEALAPGPSLRDVCRARDNLRQMAPASDLLELLEAKIKRLGGGGPKGVSAWGA